MRLKALGKAHKITSKASKYTLRSVCNFVLLHQRYEEKVVNSCIII